MPVFGTAKLDRLKENIAALDIGLTGQDLQCINWVTAIADLQGNRYSAALQKAVNRYIGTRPQDLTIENQLEALNCPFFNR